VRVTLPNADRDALAAIPGVTAVEVRGDTVRIACSDSDEVARHLLTQTAATNLEIAANTLEAAFVALTADAEVAA
jgi:ABC-2 type transport system ATP-binding protein